MNRTPLFYCISHKDPGWPLPSFMTVVGTGGYVPEGGIGMSVACPELAFQNNLLGEYAALFMIRRMLLESRAEGFIGICHYRRFALTVDVGQAHGFNFHAHPDQVQGLPPEAFYGDGATPIVSMPVAFAGTVLQQYAANAVGRDLLLFFGDAIDCGVITSEQAAAFLSGNSFITAGNVGVVPVEWFVEIIGAVEQVAQRFKERHHIPRSGYDERCIGLCCERLHALLLLNKALAYGAERVISRPLTVLTPGASQ